MMYWVMVYWQQASSPAVSFIFQNDKIFRPGGVESKVGNCIAGRSEPRIVQFAFQVLSIFSKYYLVARTRECGGNAIANRVYIVTGNEPNYLKNSGKPYSGLDNLMSTGPQQMRVYCRSASGHVVANHRYGPLTSRLLQIGYIARSGGEDFVHVRNVFGLLVSGQAIDKSFSVSLFQKTVVQQSKHATIFYRADQAAKTLFKRYNGRWNLIFKKRIAPGGVDGADSRGNNRIIGHRKRQTIDYHAA